MEHSRAKVKLLSTYLVNYLSVLTNSSSISRIRIYDVFCGRGVYVNDGEGSPIAILRAVKNNHFRRKAAGKNIPVIDCYFSDKDSGHVESVRNAIAKFHLHYEEFGKLECNPADSCQTMQRILSETSKSLREKTFVFIDPYGYKDIKPSEIKALLGKGAEVLLFVPVQFMYRFDGNSAPDAFRELISEMRPFEKWQVTSSPGHFVEQLRNVFREYLGERVFVSTFLIEKDPNTLFSLFFFTTHLLGHERMIDAKWKMDQDAGRGWSYRRVPGQTNLIEGQETVGLEKELLEFLSTGNRSNCDVYRFTVIEREYRATHATKICKNLISNKRLRAHSGTERVTGLYINYEHFQRNSQRVRFEVI